MIKDEASGPARPLDLRRHLHGQRGRILDAMAQAVAANGYAATAVGDVIAVYRMSRRTFYQHFPNKEECFIAAYDFAIDVVAAEVSRSFVADDGADWRTRIRRAFETFMSFVVNEPDFARMCLVEVLAAGPRALERREAAGQRFSAFVSAAANRAPGSPFVPETVPEAVVGGIQSVISSRLLNGRAHELPALVDDLLLWGMVPFVDHDVPGRENSPVS